MDLSRLDGQLSGDRLLVAIVLLAGMGWSTRSLIQVGCPEGRSRRSHDGKAYGWKVIF